MQKGDLVGLIIVVTILVSIAAFLVFAPKAPKVTYTPVEITGSSVVLSDTQAVGRSVLVSVEVKQRGFVTIHQAIGDAPGPVIGQSPLLDPGSYAELSVEATEILQPPGQYFILLFVDDGDGVYEAGVDLPVMSEGQVIKQKLSL